MKIYIHPPNENWILDRYAKEWCQYNSNHSTKDILSCDVLWMLDNWTWDEIDPFLLENKKLVSTICHIVLDKHDHEAFRYRDQFVNHYHAMSDKTAKILETITDKPIISLQFWVNENIWHELSEVDKLRAKHNLPARRFLVGSFQRDTEGYDLKSPKLEKGPDLFCDYMEKLKKTMGDNFEVVLAGWRRQYVTNRLNAAGIKYHYFEMCDFETLNELYNCIDLYVVSSRIEGGPQAIPECAITRTPIISTDVGLASEILAPENVNNDLDKAVPNMAYAYDRVQQYKMENHFSKFVEFFEGLI